MAAHPGNWQSGDYFHAGTCVNNGTTLFCGVMAINVIIYDLSTTNMGHSADIGFDIMVACLIL